MKGVITNGFNVAEVQTALVLGRHKALADTDELVSQLSDQLHEARDELQRVRAECDERIAAARKRFIREANELKEMLNESFTELHRLRTIMELGGVDRTTEMLQ
jgi:hypothetical protein